MATRTQVMITCDVCGGTKDVQTRTFGLDGRTYGIDLCPEDGQGLSEVAAGYVPRARKVTARQSPRPPGAQKRGRGRVTGSAAEKKKASRSGQQAAKASNGRQEKGIYVYGILPADIEVAEVTPGVGEHPGPLEVIRSNGLAALISEVDLSGRLGSRDDLSTHREILDATAAEVPVVPLRFGTVLASKDAVAEELLVARHDEFADALHQLEGRA